MRLQPQVLDNLKIEFGKRPEFYFICRESYSCTPSPLKPGLLPPIR